MSLRLSCETCFEPYTENGIRVPLNLPCGHCFCKECVSGFKKKECPMCRATYTAARVDDLPHNFALVGLIESNNNSNKALPPQPVLKRGVSSYSDEELQAVLETRRKAKNSEPETQQLKARGGGGEEEELSVDELRRQLLEREEEAERQRRQIADLEHEVESLLNFFDEGAGSQEAIFAAAAAATTKPFSSSSSSSPAAAAAVAASPPVPPPKPARVSSPSSIAAAPAAKQGVSSSELAARCLQSVQGGGGGGGGDGGGGKAPVAQQAHDLVDYRVQSKMCTRCNCWGPSSDNYTGTKECSRCELCRTCCKKNPACRVASSSSSSSSPSPSSSSPSPSSSSSSSSSSLVAASNIRYIRISNVEKELVLSQVGVYAKSLGQENVASLKTVTGSSDPNGTAFRQIVDGNFSDRRWQDGLCLYAPNQWAQVDLGGPFDLSQVVVVLSDRYEGLPLLHHYKLHLLDANHVQRQVIDFSEAARSGNNKRIYTFVASAVDAPEAPAGVFASVASFIGGFVKRS